MGQSSILLPTTPCRDNLPVAPNLTTGFIVFIRYRLPMPAVLLPTLTVVQPSRSRLFLTAASTKAASSRRLQPPHTRQSTAPDGAALRHKPNRSLCCVNVRAPNNTDCFVGIPVNKQLSRSFLTLFPPFLTFRLRYSA